MIIANFFDDPNWEIKAGETKSQEQSGFPFEEAPIVNQDNVWLSTAGNNLTFTSSWEPPQTLSFFNKEELLGAIDFSGPELTFSGKADETAKVFFDSLILYHSTYIKDLQDQIQSLKSK